MMKLDDEISVEMHRISSARLKKSAISKSISHLQSTLHNLEKQKKQQLAHIEDSQKKLNEMTKSESIRRDLLSGIGVSPLTNQFNVKRATLESHMKTQRGHLESLENQVAETQEQIDEQTLLLDPKHVEDLRQQVEAKIVEIKLHKVDLESARFQVATQLSECQHLIDDVKMRITLENFAYDNKLVANDNNRETLENMSIEDLVKLCEDSRPPPNNSPVLTNHKSSPQTPSKHHIHSYAISQNNHHHNHHNHNNESISDNDSVSDCSEGRHAPLESEDEQECTDEECSCRGRNQQSHLTKKNAADIHNQLKTPNKDHQELIQHAHTEIYRLDGGYTRAATKELTCIKSGWMNF